MRDLHEMMIVEEKTKKRTFLGLLLTALMLIIIVIFYFYFYTGNPDIGFLHTLTLVIIVAAFLFTALIFCGLFLIVCAILKKRTFPGFAWFVGRTLHLYPLVLEVGRLFSVAQDKIQRSFIEVNNQLLCLNPIKAKNEKILLLLPHCLQNNNCPVRVTEDISNCKRCGKCQIGSLLDLSVAKGIQTKVVTGGTLARQAVVRCRPKLVVAVACERDLSSGVLDSYPQPVFGVLNERPEGPCHNTRVDLQKVEAALNSFIDLNHIF